MRCCRTISHKMLGLNSDGCTRRISTHTCHFSLAGRLEVNFFRRAAMIEQQASWKKLVIIAEPPMLDFLIWPGINMT